MLRLKLNHVSKRGHSRSGFYPTRTTEKGSCLVKVMYLCHYIGNPGELYHLKGRCLVTVWLETKLLCSIGLWYRIMSSLHHSRAYVFATYVYALCIRKGGIESPSTKMIRTPSKRWGVCDNIWTPQPWPFFFITSFYLSPFWSGRQATAQIDNLPPNPHPRGARALYCIHCFFILTRTLLCDAILLIACQIVSAGTKATLL